jgi:hypothetical protein
MNHRLLISAGLFLAAAPLFAATVRPEALRQAMGLKLGMWQGRVTVTDISVEAAPDADPAEVEKIKAALLPQIGQTKVIEECLWNSPHQLFIPGLKIEGGCEFSRVQAGAGRFGVAGACARPEAGHRMEMAMDGTYSAGTMSTTYDILTTTGQLRIRMRAKSDAHHSGPCDFSAPLPPK